MNVPITTGQRWSMDYSIRRYRSDPVLMMRVFERYSHNVTHSTTVELSKGGGARLSNKMAVAPADVTRTWLSGFYFANRLLYQWNSSKWACNAAVNEGGRLCRLLQLEFRNFYRSLWPEAIVCWGTERGGSRQKMLGPAGWFHLSYW